MLRECVSSVLVLILLRSRLGSVQFGSVRSAAPVVGKGSAILAMGLVMVMVVSVLVSVVCRSRWTGMSWGWGARCCPLPWCLADLVSSVTIVPDSLGDRIRGRCQLVVVGQNMDLIPVL